MNIHVVTEFLQAAAATIAVGRLIWLGLARRFPALLAYLILLAAANFISGVLPQNSTAYFHVYQAYVPLDCVFSVLAVRELFSLVFSDYPGIVTVGRWAMYTGTALAAGLSLVLANVFWRKDARYHSNTIQYLELSQRSILFSLVVVIATILFVLSRYPLQLRRNTWVLIAFFSTLFMSLAAALLIDSLAPHLYNRYVDGAEAIFIVLCVTGWAIQVQREPSPKVSRIHFSIQAEAHLMEQLESLNRFLGHAGRR